MMLQKLALVALASAPSALAAVIYAASVPQHIAYSVASEKCTLPDDFEIQGLGGSSVNGSSFNTLDFTFYDNSTLIKTQCHLNSSSTPLGTDGRTPRYLCENDNIQFIFQQNKITIIEALCPGDDGIEDYESAGSFTPVLPACNGTSSGSHGSHGSNGSHGMTCALAAGPLVSSKFSSINIVPGSATAQALASEE